MAGGDRWLGRVAAFIILGTSSWAGAEEVLNDVIPNVGHSFPIHIGAVNHIVQGRISSESSRGTLVPSNVIMEGNEDTDIQAHLQVEVRESIYTRPHIYDPSTKFNPIIPFTNSTLPSGMQFVVIQTEAFVVNADRYLVVNNFEHLKASGDNLVHFDVILMDKLAETHYVSNQLPFVVEIEYRDTTPNMTAALFAGVLILTIIAIAFIIPFAVRSKRRSKAGKPICGCGSADDGSELDSTGSGQDLKRRDMSIRGKDNLAMILDKGRRSSVDQHTTIQNRELRTTSTMKFQPHFMDPHYRDIYKRPDFSHLHPNAIHGVTGYSPFHNSSNNNNGLDISAAGQGLSSNRSSLSSICNYPANFNSNFFTTNGGHSGATAKTHEVQNGALTSTSAKSISMMETKQAAHRSLFESGDAVDNSAATAVTGFVNGQRIPEITLNGTHALVTRSDERKLIRPEDQAPDGNGVINTETADARL